MAPQTATTDEDLLIISDDSASEEVSLDDAAIEISLDDTPTAETPAENVIDFGAEATQEVAVDDTTQKEATPTETESNDLSIDLGSADLSIDDTVKEDSKTPTETEVEAPKTEAESDFSLDLGTTSSDETVAETPVAEPEKVQETTSFDLGASVEAPAEVSADTGMNMILAETISKLEARQDAIASEKDGKSSQVTDLKAQIKKLQDEVALHEWEIEELSAESKKIATNVKSLEKMKLDEDVTKEHNSKRVPKK